MREKRKKQLKREAKNFSITSIIATVIDYFILNVLTLLFHVPTIPSNVVSTTVSSVASYKLNEKIVFEGRRYSMKKTVILYIAITAISIYLIQNICLYLFDDPIKSIGSSWPEFVQLNITKICASMVAGIWNYFMLRYFVFIPETKKDEIEAAD